MNSKILIPTLVILILIFGVVFYFANEDSKKEDKFAKSYVGYSAEECRRIQITCVAGFKRFDNNNGCGCEIK